MKSLNNYIYESIFHKSEIYENNFHKSEIYENNFHKSEIYENNFHKSEINEKLVINKDLKTSYPELVDKIYKNNVNWGENGITKIYRTNAILSSFLRTKLYNIISNTDDVEINYKDREQLITKMVDYIYLKNERCFQFSSGNHPQIDINLMNKSIEKVVKKILNECVDVDIIYEDKKNNFIIFGIKGAECQVLSMGSPILRLTFVSPIPSDEEITPEHFI